MLDRFMNGFSDEIEKIAKIYGAERPPFVFAPGKRSIEGRDEEYSDYLRKKSKEKPTGTVKAMGGGGLIGSGIGAAGGTLAGLIRRGAPTKRGVGLGAAVGAGLGTLLGRHAKKKDEEKIERAKRLLKDPKARREYVKRKVAEEEALEREAGPEPTLW